METVAERGEKNTDTEENETETLLVCQTNQYCVCVCLYLHVCLPFPTHAGAFCQSLKVLLEKIFLTAVTSVSYCPQCLIHTCHFGLLLLFISLFILFIRTVLAQGLHICRI